MKIAICDDEPIFVSMMRKVVEESCESMGLEYDIYEYLTGEAILEDLEKDFDLVLLDIRLPGVSGFDVATEIYRATHGDNIFFVSNEEQLVYVCLEFRPAGFIRKRLFREDFGAAFKKWYELYGKKITLRINPVDSDVEIEIKANRVMYIEQKLHYAYIHTDMGVYKERTPLSKYDYLLEDYSFVKCNVSNICNFRYVITIKEGRVQLVRDVSISISRKLKKYVIEKYYDYMRAVY